MKLADVFRVVRTTKLADAQRFAQHVVPEVVRPARVIWNQAIGGLFALFAFFFFGYAYNYYRDVATDSRRGVALGFSLFLGLVMAFFSLTSFRQARRIARPRMPGRR